MHPSSKTTRILVACMLCAAMTLLAHGQASRQVARVDAAGMHIDTFIGENIEAASRPPAELARSGVIWHVHDDNSIAYSVCLSDTTDETWVGHNLNVERLSYHQTTGDGTPIYELDLVPENPTTVVVDSAEDVSLGVLAVRAGGACTVRGFSDASGTTPLWTYTFDTGYEIIQTHGLDVSADGAVVAAVTYVDGVADSLIVVLDGATGAELNRLQVDAYITAVELSDDGSRAVLTEGATARVIETAGMTTLHSFAVSGSGGVARISRNGLVAAAGGFNYKAYRDTGSGWTLAYSGTGTQQWFGGGIGLSGDGNTLFVVSHKYTGYLDLTYRIIDLVGGTEIASTTTSGTGTLQDSVQRAQVSADGEIFAVASWGTQDNAHPEVQVFDRTATLIGSIDMPGSPFDLDLSADGRYVVTGGKAVHANDMGRGADVYTYEVYEFCFGDLDGDGDVDLSDLAELLGHYGTASGATYEMGDLDGDGDVDLSDLAALLGVYGTTC